MSLRRLLAASCAIFLPILALQGATSEAVLKETPLMADESKTVLQLLEHVHYLNTPVTNAKFEKLITEYMYDLDDQRMFFTADDQRTLVSTYKDELGPMLRDKGDLTAAFKIFSVYRERAKARAAWVAEALKKDFDFTINESYVYSRKDAPWPATTAEADELWRKRLKFELLPDLLNNKTIEEAKKTVAQRYDRLSKNLDELESSDIEETFLSTLTRLYDPHSTFFSAETYEDFSISMRLSLVGIGALLASEDGNCVVKELIPGGPAILSKQVHPNDKIVAVAQAEGEPVDVIGMNLRKVVNLIRGQKGTTIHLTVVPGDAADNSVRNEVTLVRDVVQLNASRAKAAIYDVPNGTSTEPIGVIDIPSFYGSVDDDTSNGPPTSVTADVEELIGKLKDAGVRGIVLDLRRNGGGLLSEAVDLTGLFIYKGPVVQVRDSYGQVSVKSDTNGKIAYSGPLMVLTSRYSASASEIVAGALQNYGRAIIVGDSSTHGKGTVQAVMEMRTFIPQRDINNSRAGAAKLTVQKFYLPNGASTQQRGVIPDISLPAIEDFLPIGESDLPNSLPWDTITAARISGRELDSALRDHLREATRLRERTLDEFGFLKKRIDWLHEREERKEITLNLEARRAMKTQDEAFRKDLKTEQSSLATSNYPHRDIKLDSVVADEPKAATPDDGDDVTSDDTVFDVHERESLRLLRDAIDISPDPRNWTQNAAILAGLSAHGNAVEPEPAASARN